MKKITRFTTLTLAVVVIALTFCFSALATETANAVTLTAANGADGIVLSWNALDDVSFYAIFRKGENEAKKQVIAKITETSYTDESVTGDIKYGYRVVPVFNDTTVGANSNDVFLERMTVPAVTGASSTTEGIKVTWTASEGALGYRLYRRAQGETKWTAVAKTKKDVLTFTDKNINATGVYTYAVRGYNGSDLSYQSNYYETDYIPAPEITKIATNKNNIGFTWTKVEKATDYIIYRATSEAKTYKRYTTVGADTLKFYDSDVKEGVIYGYIVRAVTAEKKAGAYNAATICKFMKMPVLKSASNTTQGVKLSWTKAPGAESYAIYRRDAKGTEWKRVIVSKGQSTLTATDKTAKNGGSYVYVIRAVWNKIQSAYDEQGISATYLSAPTGVKVETKSSGVVSISWKANKHAVGYYVYRKADGGSWTNLGATKKTAVYDKTAKSGVIYSYAIRAAISQTCTSAASEVVSSSRINPKGKMVALTYDDGPSNSVTNDILDILEEYDAKATFFVIGNRITSNYQPMQRAVKMGCEIGNHTYSHIDLPSYSSSVIKEEISMTDDLVRKYTGVTPKIARAPGGSTDSYSRQAVNKPFLYWSVDTRDWESRSASSVISIVKDEVADGSIILMHDIYDSTAEASETIIPWLINQGYQLVTISELMYYRGITMQNAVTYYDAYR